MLHSLGFSFDSDDLSPLRATTHRQNYPSNDHLQSIETQARRRVCFCRHRRHTETHSESPTAPTPTPMIIFSLLTSPLAVAHKPSLHCPLLRVSQLRLAVETTPPSPLPLLSQEHLGWRRGHFCVPTPPPALSIFRVSRPTYNTPYSLVIDCSSSDLRSHILSIYTLHPTSV